MLTSTSLLVATMVAAVGGMVWWANPRRPVNQLIFTSSLHVAAWLLCLFLTSYVGGQGSLLGSGFWWMKMTTSIGGLMPVHLWFVKEAIVNDGSTSARKLLARARWWLLPSLFAGIVPFTEIFIPSASTPQHRLFGWGYYAYIVVTFLMHVTLMVNALRTTKRLTGGRRLELQVWLCGACGTAFIILVRMALRAFIRDQTSLNLQPLAVFVFYAGAAYAITTHRIFDSRQIFLVVLEKTLLVGFVAGAAFLFDLGFSEYFSAPVALIATTAAALWFAYYANRQLDRVFQFYPDAGVVRQAIFTAARRHTKLDELREAFLSLLKGWGHTDHSVILFGGKDAMDGGKVELAAGSPVIGAMRQLRWVTPERLTRERATPERAAAAAFLVEQRLGAMVIAEGPSLTVFIGVGIAASRRPFTYPQVIQLMEVASIMESALERAVFSVKAQHAEQLATVGLLGASLAHEIRNPLVTIKTFVQLLPTHYKDEAFRTKFFSLIGDEVTRIDHLTEQLLDMASPHTYSAQVLELHAFLSSSVELVAAKATDKKIAFLTEFGATPDLVLTDPSAAKQVLLNLCFNAIQAVESRAGERWVKVCTRNVANGIEMSVRDSGPGISPEIRPRLFQPFQTTKSSGFGLGLAICSDILAGLDATISVDPSVPGEGATFRVVFPCPA